MFRDVRTIAFLVLRPDVGLTPNLLDEGNLMNLGFVGEAVVPIRQGLLQSEVVGIMVIY